MVWFKRRSLLKGSDAKSLLRELSESFGVDVERHFGAKPKIEVVNFSRGELFIINDKPTLIRFGGVILPALTFDAFINSLPKVLVDIGAVPYVCNGADVMAPGVVKVEGEFEEGSLVAVFDENHRKAIAIAKALKSSRVIMNLKHGKVLENLHYVGDAFWEAIKAVQKRKS